MGGEIAHALGLQKPTLVHLEVLLDAHDFVQRDVIASRPGNGGGEFDDGIDALLAHLGDGGRRGRHGAQVLQPDGRSKRHPFRPKFFDLPKKFGFERNGSKKTMSTVVYSLVAYACSKLSVELCRKRRGSRSVDCFWKPIWVFIGRILCLRCV